MNPNAYRQRKGWNLDPRAQAGGCEMRDGLNLALDAIEEPWRKPVELHFLAGMPQKELAAFLGVSQQMVSRRIERGLALLRLHLA